MGAADAGAPPELRAPRAARRSFNRVRASLCEATAEHPLAADDAWCDREASRLKRKRWADTIDVEIWSTRMTTATRTRAAIALPLVCIVVLGVYRGGTLGQTRDSIRPNQSVCEREVEKLRGRRLAGSIRAPKRIRHASPDYPPLPGGTTGGGIWIGEALIDTFGRVSQVWTIREVKLAPPSPSLNKAITDAVLQWEFTPLLLDKVAVPACTTVTVNVNVDVIKGRQ
jgi:hypothetical protein